MLTYAEEIEGARAAGESHRRFDQYSFAISFKGVLLEGLKVAFIVLTFGSNQQRRPRPPPPAGLGRCS